MPTDFVGITSAAVTASASITLAQPPDVEAGDLLYAVVFLSVDPKKINVQPNVNWKKHVEQVSFGGASASASTAFAYAEEVEAATYTFGLDGTVNAVGFLYAIRGAKRDRYFDVVNYPFGFFAPGGSEGVASTGSSASLGSVSAAKPSIDIQNSRVLYAFAQEGASPRFDDVVPLIPIRAKVENANWAATAGDREYAAVTTTVAALALRTTINGQWMVFSVAIESEDPLSVSQDSYKAKILRGMLPSPPYDTRFQSNLGKILTVIGTSDNDIGGLFGAADFLPDGDGG
jgi:hypothetical protein